MLDTSFFTQCENCEYCDKELFGYVCCKHEISISNPKKDGCTWGSELDRKETDNERKTD